jgi:putative ABC transport system permease protein
MLADLRRVAAGVDAFRRHRVRTALSAVGVMLAVAVTLATLAVQDGARLSALRDVERLGATTVVVRGDRLTLHDAAAMTALADVVAVAPLLERRATIDGPVASHAALIRGVTQTWAAVRDVRLADGRSLRPADDALGARVCVLDARLARRLFGRVQAVGGHVRIGGSWHTVVGTTLLGEDAAFVPFSALASRRADADPGQLVSAIWIRSRSASSVPATAQAVRARLDRIRRGRYDVVVAQELLANRDATRRLFAVVGAVIALLLFLLGGTAIANVMLTSVLERTSEIGLRRAVGATRRDVLLQFLCEGAAVAVVGATGGIAVGAALTILTAFYSGWPAPLSAASVLATFAVATVLGVVAAAYPAARAAAIQPIHALNHE